MGKSKHITTGEVAELFGLPLVTIQRWEHQGKIPYKIIGNKRRYNRKELLEWARIHDLTVNLDIRGATASPEHVLYHAIERSGIYNKTPGNNIVEVFENALDVLPFFSKQDRKRILVEMLDREELASTGVGHGIAIPHTRERFQIGSEQIFIPVLFLENHIEFKSIDGEAVFVLFMIFTANTKDHLKVLSRISHILKDQKILEILREKNNSNNLLSRILKIEKDLNT